MLTAWDAARVKNRHLQYARKVVDLGVKFRAVQPTDYPAIEQLVRTHITGTGNFRFDEHGGGVCALDSAGTVIGAVVAGAAQFEGGQIVVFVRHVVVDPAWRGKGVGVVALNSLSQVQPASMYLGNCAAPDGAFYQRAGYTVLDPGQGLPFALGKPVLMQVSNPDYPCWFFK